MSHKSTLEPVHPGEITVRGRSSSPRYTRATTVFLTVASALLTGLSGCSPSDSWMGTINEVDGVIEVTNPADPLWKTHTGDEARLAFKLEQVFGADTEPIAAILGSPAALHAAADASGNLYVLDDQADRLVSFAPDGTVRWQTGGSGAGPGELDRPADIAVSAGGSVMVLNQRSTRLDSWDKRGGYVSSLALQELPLPRADYGAPYLAGFLTDDILVIYGIPLGRTGARIVTVDLRGRAIRSDFEWDQLPDIERPPGGWVFGNVGVRAQRGAILVGSHAGYQFRIYSQDGSTRRHVRRQVDYPARAGTSFHERSMTTLVFGELLAPMYLEPGYMLVCATWVPDIDDPDEVAARSARASREGRPTEPMDWLSSYDLYDRDGRLLYSLAEAGTDWPSTGVPEFIGRDNRLYTISDDPFPQIRRYEVVVR